MKRISLIAIAITLVACSSQARRGRPAMQSDAGPDPGNTVYRIDGQEVRLVDGKAEGAAAPGSASSTRTALFGAPVSGDLDGDGLEDAAVLLAQEPGGSGTFYYAAAALRGAGGLRGTNAVLFGDRVAPQSVAVRDGKVIVDYADRRPGEPMTTPPSEGRTLVLVVRNGELVALPPATGGAADLPLAIVGLEWRLARLVVDGKDFALAAEGAPTFAVDAAGKVQGLATLNRYFGQAELESDGRLRWAGPFGATRMAGPEPLMEQERLFLQALENARRALLREGRLLFQDEGGRIVLEFRR